VSREYIYYILDHHLGKILGVFIGLVIALAFIFFGFWRGLLFIVLVGIGFYLGDYWDKEKTLPIKIKRLLPPKK